MTQRNIEIGATYRHFKGFTTKVIAIAKHTETMEELVIYEHEGSIWARPYDMFNSLVDKEKYPDIKQKYRFEKISK